MAAEPTILGVHGDLQAYQTSSSNALKRSLNTQPAAANCDDEETSEVCQDRSTTVSTKRLLPSEAQQLLDPAVKLPEKEQMVGAAFQNGFKDKTLFPEQTNENLLQPVNVQSSVELLQLTLHPEVVVHFRRGQFPGDAIEPQPFVKDSWTQTDNSEPTNQSVEPTIGQKESVKENLTAVVKLNRLPISTLESVLVSRPPTSSHLDCWSFSKPGPTEDMSSPPAPTTPLNISERDFSIPASLPPNMSEDHLRNEENSNVCTEKVTVDFRSKNKYLKDSAPLTPPVAVAFDKNEFSTGKTTLKPQEGKIVIEDFALPDRSEEETQSTTFKLNSKPSKDAGEFIPLSSKDQLLAQIAASSVEKVPKEVCSALFCEKKFLGSFCFLALVS